MSKKMLTNPALKRESAELYFNGNVPPIVFSYINTEN